MSWGEYFMAEARAQVAARAKSMSHKISTLAWYTGRKQLRHAPATASKRLDQAKSLYREARAEVSQLVRESGNDRERHDFSEIVAREQTFINSTNPEKIQAATAELDRIRWQILSRTPDFLIGMFEHLVERRASMNDQVQGKQLIDGGKRAIANEAWDELRQINGRLWDLMPATEQASEEMRVYTGIV